MSKRVRLNLSVDVATADGMRNLANKIGIRTLSKLNKIILAWVLQRIADNKQQHVAEPNDAEYIERMFQIFTDAELNSLEVQYRRKKGVGYEP